MSTEFNRPILNLCPMDAYRDIQGEGLFHLDEPTVAELGMALKYKEAKVIFVHLNKDRPKDFYQDLDLFLKELSKTHSIAVTDPGAIV